MYTSASASPFGERDSTAENSVRLNISGRLPTPLSGSYKVSEHHL
jgi:hypothetical protein